MTGASHRTRRAIYLYCIGKADELAPHFRQLLPDGIEPPGRLKPVLTGDLAAVVSTVPLEHYGETPLKEHLDDPAWTAVRALRHERVVEHFAHLCSVIPLRFGTVFLTEARIRKMLAEKSKRFQELLETLRDREEWEVCLGGDSARLREKAPAFSPRLRELEQRTQSARPGEAYLLHKQIALLREEESRREIARLAEEVRDRLKELSAGVVALPLRPPELEPGQAPLARFAFLVPRSRFEEFHQVAEQIARAHAASGFSLQLKGPWPAYNFVNDAPRFHDE